MDLYYDRVEIQVNLDNLKHNVEQLHNNISDKTKIIAVVKTDAYGHGASAIAAYLEPLPYIWGFAVATVEEGVTLRREGITKPILVLGATFSREIKKSVSYNLASNIFDYETACALSREAKRQNKIVYFHLSVDSGMGRLGFRDNEDDIKTIQKIAGLDNVDIEGLFTHFSKADEVDLNPTKKQMEYFDAFTLKLENLGIKCRIRHAANSAGIINGMGDELDAVRAGISMYGMYPSSDVNKENAHIKPVLSLKSKVIFVKDVDAGATISYGGTFVTPHKMKIATVPVGYGDGYPRALSGKGYVLIRGVKVPILGRVCMDQLMVDVSNVKDIQTGDVVTLIGKDGDEIITLDELAVLADRFNYEFVCDFNKRIPRCYYEDGNRVETLDYFYK